MSGRGYCTDCFSWTAIIDGRCGCGSGRVIVPPAGYRLLAPGELDSESLERAAESIECLLPEHGAADPQDKTDKLIDSVRRDDARYIRALGLKGGEGQ